MGTARSRPLEAEVDGLVEAPQSSEAPVDGSIPEEEFNKSDEDLMEAGDGSQERKALEEALSSLAGSFVEDRRSDGTLPGATVGYEQVLGLRMRRNGRR